MNTDTDIDLVRDRVKEIVAGVRFSQLPSHRAIVELMTLFRTNFQTEYQRGHDDCMKSRDINLYHEYHNKQR